MTACPYCYANLPAEHDLGCPNRKREVILPINMTPEMAIDAISQEFYKARKKFAPMRGPHEGYAVILEELDEAWDEIKANNIPKARKEMLQVAAMALAFLVEVGNDG